jgi:hypothetical protein
MTAGRMNRAQKKPPGASRLLAMTAHRRGQDRLDGDRLD